MIQLPARALLALLALATPPGADLHAAYASRSGDDSIFVSTAWVAERLEHNDLVLFHVGSRASYEAAHLPDARHVAMPAFAEERGGLTLQLPSVARLDSTFEALGVSDDSRIILYFAENWVTPTARLYLTLEYLGLGPRTSVMDGGLRAWQAERRPVTREIPPSTRGTITPHPQAGLVTDAAWLSRQLDAPDVAIIDARTSNYYEGVRGGHAQPRAGHIPGAGNVPFTSIVDDSLKLKPRGELERLFADAGARPGQTVVTYCHIGQQASLVYLAARHLGFEARLYDGSFEDWSRRTELAVVRPAAQRLAKLISTEELAQRLQAGEELSIIDLRSDFFSYLQGHVPGAAYLHYESLRATNESGVPADLLPAGSYATLFSRLGLRRDRPVVVYSGGAGPNFNATFLAWILVGFDHPGIYLLDGGFEKWQAEGRNISRSYPAIQESNFPAEPFQPHVARLGLVRWAVEHADSPDGDQVALVDVRPVEQYAGHAGAQVRRGRIPGAINHVWSSDLVEEGSPGTWRSIADLRASYESQGITPDKHVILYCNTGTEATHVYFALRNLLGYPSVDVYFPSWTEWSAIESLPVVSAGTP